MMSRQVDIWKRPPRQATFDYILLDCRAGLHDLGGLSLTDVAHVNVLVGRDTPQGREGLALTLDVLAARRSPASQRLVLVQTFVPLPLGGDAAEITKTRVREAMYDASVETLYKSVDDPNMPGADDDQAAHYPRAIGQYDEIAVSQRLADLTTARLEGESFTALRRRIEALVAPQDEGEDEDGPDAAE